MPVKFCRSIKRSPKSDPQQYRLYRMENEAIGSRSYLALSRPALRRYLRALTREFGAPPIKVVFEDLGRWAAEWREPNIIVFGQKAHSRDLLTAAHEFAHHLHSWLAGDRLQQSHGPEFMACYMAVLDVSRFMPVAALKVVCSQYKLAYRDPGKTISVDRLRRVVCQ